MTLRDSSSDDSLVERLRGGDHTALGMMYDEYATALLGSAYTYVRRRDVAEDLVHDVFVRLWERRAELVLRGTIQSYLFSAVRNAALDFLKHERVAHRWESADPGEEFRPSIAWNTAEHALYDEEVRSMLDAAIAQLPPQRRQVIVLRWQRGLSYAEIAEVMGSSVAAVERQLHRTLRALRDLLPEK